MEAPWWSSVVKLSPTFVLLCAGLGSACGPSLPDSYGIYANTTSGRIRLVGQSAAVGGSMLNPVLGVKEPSGGECEGLKSFFVYQQGITSRGIEVSRLEFVGVTAAPALGRFFGQAQQEVNLWVPRTAVEIDIEPVSNHADMYLVTPRKALGKGFYALFVEGMGATDPSRGGVLFDVVVGKKEDFPGHEALVRRRRDAIQRAAADLLREMNEIFNGRDYARLADVYRPNSQILAGSSLSEFVSGSETWSASSGRIVVSEITGCTVSTDGTSAECGVKTRYEKAGQQAESIVVAKLGDHFFLTSLR